MKTCVIVILQDDEVQDAVSIIADTDGRMLPGSKYSGEQLTDVAHKVFEEQVRKISPEEEQEELDLSFEEGSWVNATSATVYIIWPDIIA